jgi:protein SYS1
MTKSKGWRGNDQFNPGLIVAQIALIQCVYYIGLCICIFVSTALTHWAHGLRSSSEIESSENEQNDSVKSFYMLAAEYFSWQAVTMSTWSGCALSLAYILNSFVVAKALHVVVKRHRKCLDFAATVFATHAIASWIFDRRFPASGFWWLIQLVALAISITFAEWLCLRSELADIPIPVRADSLAVRVEDV